MCIRDRGTEVEVQGPIGCEGKPLSGLPPQPKGVPKPAGRRVCACACRRLHVLATCWLQLREGREHVACHVVLQASHRHWKLSCSSLCSPALYLDRGCHVYDDEPRSHGLSCGAVCKQGAVLKAMCRRLIHRHTQFSGCSFVCLSRPEGV